MVQKILSLLFLVGVLFLSACKKHKEDDNLASNGSIEIKLDSQFMPANKIDSALAIWEIAGQTQIEKMQLSGDYLRVDLQKFAQGNGRLTIQLYTKTMLGDRDLQWEKRMNSSIIHHESIRISAPTSLTDMHWFPRVIMIDPSTGFTAIVGVNTHDPYFMVKNIPPQWNKIELERGYYRISGGAESIGKGFWRCNSGCTGVIENRTFFEFLPTQIANRPWAMVEIGVALYNNTPMPGPSFYFNHY